MHKSLSAALCAVVLIVLTSCSSEKPSSKFTLEGVEPPPSSSAGCSQNPDDFGDAQSLGSHGGGACTVRNAWRVSSMSGVQFSEPQVVNCAVANSFNNWLVEVAQPMAQRVYGARIAKVGLAASYSCRPRNNVRGAKLSQHGFGNAFDVMNFTLDDGQKISVLNDYYSSPFLQSVRKSACGRFMTVLGPGTDGSHKDHFHFDLEHRKSGQTYCH